eukprot:TRINITY_DN18008_c0_g1_i1.p1 TRINITY_DN18008_c0_g1~~TRINITY_DN18008_c0_g1_i1.p1  ORF type:complete len:305 (-),score=93.59 TRINITY_DN18008_c0_g1_i1:64-978(-)
MDDAAARVELEGTLIVTNTYRMTLRLPQSVMPARDVVATVLERFSCCRCVSSSLLGAGSDLYCGTCRARPVSLTCAGVDGCAFYFTLTPHCTSSRAHFGGELLLVLPVLPGGQCVVSPAFRILSRNCKYNSKNKAAHALSYPPPTKLQQPMKQQQQLSASTALMAKRVSDADHGDDARVHFPQPVLVDASLSLTILGDASPFSILLTSLTVVASKLTSPRPAITVGFIETECFAAHARQMQELHPLPPNLRQLPVHKHLVGPVHCIIHALYADEFAFFVTVAHDISNSGFVRDGRVRLLPLVVL